MNLNRLRSAAKAFPAACDSPSFTVGPYTRALQENQSWRSPGSRAVSAVYSGIKLHYDRRIITGNGIAMIGARYNSQ